MADKSKPPTDPPVDAGDANASANGHWQHDKAGPRRYVPAASDTGDGKEIPDDTAPER